MKKNIIILFVFVCLSFIGFTQNFEYYNGNLIESNYIVFKYKPRLLKSATNSEISNEKLLANYLQTIGASTPTQKYPNAIIPDSCKECVDIRLIYDFNFTSDINISKVISYLQNIPNIEYAEPNYIHQLLFIPDDTETPSQWHLNTCEVFAAWDETKGDTNVVIGIADAGFAITHSDLVNQIKYNYNDPINGFDDDTDGYIDNFRGWDFANKDNNPDIGTSDHGTWVAGISSAQTNNAFAVTGIGYKCKFLPIKIATDGGYITRGYEGIVYAAEHDCDIINCSWGSSGSYSNQGQDIINYATFNCNALVVAAAGNDNNQGIFYPASYNNVISVATTVMGDEKWTNTATKGSNWNYYVDVCAPSVGFKTTAKPNGVTPVYGGTSFASPIISGLAALIKSKNPNYTALEIGEKIRVNTDDIYGIESNAPYTDLLGSGRVNVLKAVVDSVRPSIRMIDNQISNRTGQYMYYAGDTLELNITFKNYLAATTNIYISISCESSIIAPINSNILIPTFGAGEEISMSVPFLFKIVSTLPPDINTFFKISYSGADYYGYEYFPIAFNPSYYDFEIGNFKATATADGSIAVFNPYLKKENGIVYKNNANMIYEGGLLLAQSENLIAANIMEHYDYNIIEFPETLTSDSVDILIASKYESPDLNLFVTQYIYAWNNKDVLIHEYRIQNQTDSIIHNLYAGAYIDWQIVNYEFNKINYIDSLQLTLISTIDPYGFYAGIMPLHYHKSNIYAFDNKFGLDTIDTSNGISDTELWYTLNHEQKTAGNTLYTNNSVTSVSSSIIGELKPDSIAIIRYAIIAGENSNDIIQTASDLNQNYEIDTTTPPIINIDKIYNNPISVHYYQKSIQISYPISIKKIQFSIIDMQGRTLYKHFVNPDSQTGIENINIDAIAAGIYNLYVDYNGIKNSYKILLKK